jgi:hypothetical protein
MTGAYDRTSGSPEERLERERPVPDPSFVGRLERRLGELETGGLMRPDNLNTLIGAFAICGMLLLLVATAGVLGSGPLAA